MSTIQFLLVLLEMRLLINLTQNTDKHFLTILKFRHRIKY